VNLSWFRQTLSGLFHAVTFWCWIMSSTLSRYGQ
jgi:hypothetical protein